MWHDTETGHRNVIFRSHKLLSCEKNILSNATFFTKHFHIDIYKWNMLADVSMLAFFLIRKNVKAFGIFKRERLFYLKDRFSPKNFSKTHFPYQRMIFKKRYGSPLVFSLHHMMLPRYVGVHSFIMFLLLNQFAAELNTTQMLYCELLYIRCQHILPFQF